MTASPAARRDQEQQLEQAFGEWADESLKIAREQEMSAAPIGDQEQLAAVIAAVLCPARPSFGVDVCAEHQTSAHAAAAAVVAAGWAPASQTREQIASEIEARADGAGRLIRVPGQKRLCTDPAHDDRWCGTCDSMEDGMDLAARIARGDGEGAPAR